MHKFKSTYNIRYVIVIAIPAGTPFPGGWSEARRGCPFGRLIVDWDSKHSGRTRVSLKSLFTYAYLHIHVYTYPPLEDLNSEKNILSVALRHFSSFSDALDLEPN